MLKIGKSLGGVGAIDQKNAQKHVKNNLLDCSGFGDVKQFLLNHFQHYSH
jgi:hypothetical protein